MKQKFNLVLIMLIIMALLVSCSEKQEPIQQAAELGQQEVKLPTVDRAGNEIIIPKELNKIISISPSNTEMIVEMGYGDKLVAVDEYSKDIQGIPDNIPFFDIMNPDIEQLVALQPDIIYATGMSMAKGNDPFKQIKDLGIAVAYIPTSDSIEGIYEDIQFMADSLQVSDKGKDLVDTMKIKVAEYKEKGSKIENKKTVYFEIAGAPNLYSFGSGVFLNEMIDIIGAKNILADQEKWISVSDEIIVAANPDVILTNVDYIPNAAEEIKNRTGWENVTAVKNNDVYNINNNASSLSNHNIIKALDEMSKSVYPELYNK